MQDLLNEKLKAQTNIMSCRKRMTDLTVYTITRRKERREKISIDHRATVSINYKTPPPLARSHFTPQIAWESKKHKPNFHSSINLHYANKFSGIVKYYCLARAKYSIELRTYMYRKFPWSMSTDIRTILKHYMFSYALIVSISQFPTALFRWRREYH
jgi:hypothetical protein